MLCRQLLTVLSTLYKILWTSIDVLYECNIGHPGDGVLPIASSILQIEHQLLEWQANLSPLSSLVTPDELKHDGDFTMERRFRLILTLRYHNIRILAHRRMLDLYLASIERGQTYDGEDSMLKQVGQRSKGICFQSASELISIVNILEHSPDPKRGLLGAWWFTLYYSKHGSILKATGASLTRSYDSLQCNTYYRCLNPLQPRIWGRRSHTLRGHGNVG